MNNEKIKLIADDCHDVMHSHTDAFSTLKNNVVTITGGTGFIGAWVTELLSYLNDAHAFNIKINLIARNTEKLNVVTPHFLHRPYIEVIKADVRHLNEIPSDTNWLIHAACNPDSRFHASLPLETMSTIANGTHSVLRAAERCSNFKMLLNLSSGLVYGTQTLEASPIGEHHYGALNCNTVSSAYAEAKRFAETLCQSSRSQARIPIVTARPFAFIGPYQSLERPWAINNFINDALSNRSIRVLGDGKTVRSYMYASDLAFWLLTILTQAQSGDVYNVGSPEEISLEHLAQLVAKEAKANVPIQIGASINPLQTSRFVPNISSAEAKFKLSLTVNLAEAIKKTISWNKLQ